MDLRERHALTYLFVSHNLGLVRLICDRVAIMYLGRIVESGPVAEIFERPAHPYTNALLEAIPRISGRKRVFEPVQGELPSPLAPPSGCAFHPRCPSATAECRQMRPELREIAPGRTAACHLLTTG
jgi:peptide/nickel transport system ATP-binding protein